METNRETIFELVSRAIGEVCESYQRHKEAMNGKRNNSLNRPPKHRDLMTLQRLEESRMINPTVYQPEWLKSCKLTKHLKVEQTAKNKHLKAELFDNIVKMKEIGSTIQAIGYNKGKPTLLILER